MRIKWNGQQLQKAVERGKSLGLEVAAIKVHEAAVVEATKSVDTGRLRGSIAYAVENERAKAPQPKSINSKAEDSNIRSTKDTATIGTNVEYALKIEYGGSVKQGAEGFLRPALDKIQPDLNKIFQQYVSQEVKRG